MLCLAKTHEQAVIGLEETARKEIRFIMWLENACLAWPEGYDNLNRLEGFL